MESREIRALTLDIAHLLLKLGHHRQKRSKDHRWKWAEDKLVRQLASKYAELARLRNDARQKDGGEGHGTPGEGS